MERDSDGEPLKDGFTYLKCVSPHKGAKVYRYDENTLIFYSPSKQKGNNVVIKIEDVGIEVLSTSEYDKELDIRFYEKDLDKISSIIGLTSNGAKIIPRSLKNHPRYKEIKKERFDALSDEEKEKRRLKGERLYNLLESKEE